MLRAVDEEKPPALRACRGNGSGREEREPPAAVGKPQPCTQGSGFALVSKGLRGRFFPTCQPYGWAFLFLASLFASPPYGTQRVDFAVLWGAGFTLNPGKWSFPSTAHISRSRCLIPSRGRALLAFAPTIFSIPLPPAGALCLPSRACCKNLRCVARSLGTRRCNHCGVGWNVAIATL